MADKQPGAASALTNNSLIAAVLAATGAIYLAREAPLERERPEAYEAALHSQGFHDIEARAWQDPLAAVEAYRRSDAHGDDKCAQAPSDDKHCNQLKTELAQRPRAAILAVMVTGGSFSEDVETRRRIRYAVLAGMNREGYAPEDPQRLDYFRLPPDRKSGVSADFPYEWFHRRNRNGDEVLVLWVNEDSALLTNGETGHPLLALTSLFKTLLPQTRPAAAANPQAQSPRAISILGPWQSDTLLSMRGERCGVGATPAGRAPFTFNFYVYGASVSGKLLRDRLPESCAEFLLSWRILSDDIVGKELVAELERRGVFGESPFQRLLSDWKSRIHADARVTESVKNAVESLGPSRRETAVALVSDWDTLYGWGVAKTVEEEIGSKATVERFSYLRGLDGVLTPNRQKESVGSDQKPGDDRAAGKTAGDPKVDPRAFDRPYGPSQADYLRRLADNLKARGQEYEFKAIGVLGNDVYDKLWVLRALKPAFPNAVFFTTDYDLALTSAKDLPYTRNLVVASSFGGELRKERQKEIPPFRSAYQTSAFFATQLALEGVQPKDLVSVAPQQAQVFEIARSGAMMELATKNFDDRAGGAADECQKEIGSCKPVIAPVRPPALRDWGRWLASVGLAVAATWLSVITAKRDEDVKSLSRAYRLHGLLYFLAVLIFGAAVAVLFWNALAVRLMSGGPGEPVALLRGIGIWPIVGLRLVVTLFCVFLTYRACRVFRDNTAYLETKVLGSKAPSAPTRQDRDARRLIDPFLAYRIDPFVDNFDESHVDEAWKAYISQGRWQLRLGRCALWSAVALLLFAVAGGFDSSPPVRDYLARYLYNFSLALNFLSASILTLFIFDATALCVSFVEGLGRSQTQWPAQAQINFAERLGVAPPGDRNASGDKDKKFGLLDYWIDLVFIEKHTSAVNSLVYYPFLVIALSILAHSAVLAAYPGGALIGVAEAVGLAMIFCCAVALRWAAERARRSAERHFAGEIVKLGEGAPAQGEWGSKQLQALLDRIRNLNGGAFSPLLEQPFIKALLLPVGSIGWATLQDLSWLWPL